MKRAPTIETLIEIIGTLPTKADFAVLDQKIGGLEQKISDLPTRTDLAVLDEKIDSLAASTAREFATIYVRFDQVDTRFARVDERFAQVDERFARVDERFDIVNTRLDTIEQGLRQLEDASPYRRLDNLEDKMQVIFTAFEKKLKIKLPR